MKASGLIRITLPRRECSEWSGVGAAGRRGLVLAGVILISYGVVSQLLLAAAGSGGSLPRLLSAMPPQASSLHNASFSGDYEFVPAYPDLHHNDSEPSLPLITPSTPSTAILHAVSPSPRLKSSSDRFPLCPDPSPKLSSLFLPHTTPKPQTGSPSESAGKLSQSVLLMEGLKERDVVERWPDLRAGGEWKPSDCRARHKVAIILPYRDRQSHLNRLLDFLIPVLMRQLLDFRFIVTEQYGHDLFNKGRIMNAAFQVAEQLGVQCVVFHDVDMFPQDDRGSYGCPETPSHLGAFVNNLGYELWYNYLVGGVLAFRMDHYRAVNGYSNSYWAWGGEDDDMGKRLLAHNLTIARPDKATMRFTMLKHTKRQRTAPTLIYKLLGNAEQRYLRDGLAQQKWRILKTFRKPLYYHVFVDVGVPPEEWRSKPA